MSLQSCLTLWDPIDGSPPGSSAPGILQARMLEWVAISFSSAWKRKVKVKSLSCVQLFTTPWTIAYWASPSMGFSRQEYWSGLPFPSPGLLFGYRTKDIRAYRGFPGGSMDKNPPVNAGNTSSVPGPGRSHTLWSDCVPVPRPLSRVLQRPKPECPRACTLQQEEPLQWEGHAPQWRVAPLTTTRASPYAAAKTSAKETKWINN